MLSGSLKGFLSHSCARLEVSGVVASDLILSEALGVCQGEGGWGGGVCSMPQTFLSRKRNPMMIYNHLDHGLYKSHLGLVRGPTSLHMFSWSSYVQPSIKGLVFVCVVFKFFFFFFLYLHETELSMECLFVLEGIRSLCTRSRTVSPCAHLSRGGGWWPASLKCRVRKT